MKLRWLTMMNNVSRDEVVEYARTNQLSLPQAKDMLQDVTRPILQYETENGWYDVPHVVEYRE